MTSAAFSASFYGLTLCTLCSFPSSRFRSVSAAGGTSFFESGSKQNPGSTQISVSCIILLLVFLLRHSWRAVRLVPARISPCVSWCWSGSAIPDGHMPEESDGWSPAAPWLFSPLWLRAAVSYGTPWGSAPFPTWWLLHRFVRALRWDWWCLVAAWLFSFYWSCWTISVDIVSDINLYQ